MSQLTSTHTAAPAPHPKPNHREDWDLVQRCVSGHRATWALLLDRYERTIYFAILNTLRNRGADAPAHLVEDIQGDILIELVRDDFRKLRKYSGRCRLAQWLKVVSSNYTIDLLRKRRPTVSLNADTDHARAICASLSSTSPSPQNTLEQREHLHHLRAFYTHLPEEDQRFVQLFYAQELSFEEVARLMDTTIGAVYARKNRVRRKLLAMANDLQNSPKH